MRPLLPAVPALVSVLAIAGCVPTDATPNTPTPSASTPPATSVPTAPPTDEPTSAPAATPVPFGCSDVITLDEMYEFNPNYSAVDYAPDAGTLAATAVGLQGIACRWVNASSGLPIDFSFALPSAEQLAQLDLAFRAGSAQTVAGRYWVTVSSPDLTTEADAAPLLALATNDLP